MWVIHASRKQEGGAILLRESNFSNSSVITVLRYGHLIIFFSVGVLAYSFESFAQSQSERQKLLTV
jgi:hypothetical protein